MKNEKCREKKNAKSQLTPEGIDQKRSNTFLFKLKERIRSQLTVERCKEVSRGKKCKKNSAFFLDSGNGSSE